MDFDINEVRTAIRNGMPPFEIRKIVRIPDHRDREFRRNVTDDSV